MKKCEEEKVQEYIKNILKMMNEKMMFECTKKIKHKGRKKEIKFLKKMWDQKMIIENEFSKINFFASKGN